MAAVFSSVIGFATITNVGDAEHQLSGVAHSSLTTEQKEKKKLAKRIIKGIQPLFDEALRKESDLAGRPFEREIPNLEALLDQKLRRQTATAGNDIVQQTIEAGTSAAEVGLDHQDEAPTVNGGDTAKGDHGLHLAPTPEDNSDDIHAARDEAADEEAIAAQFGQDAIHANGRPGHDPMDVDHEADNGRAAPPTPPGSDQDLLGPIHHGGVPWYMKEFDPEGTTVYEERWTGREVLRDMSEELSELDDDELNGLADPEAMMPADGTAPETGVSESLQKAVARKQKKRRRIF